MSNHEHHRATARPRGLSIKETGDALNLSRWTIGRLIAAGRLRSVKIGKSRRIPEAEVGRLLSEREVPTR